MARKDSQGMGKPASSLGMALHARQGRDLWGAKMRG